jgi:hypothetical protein
MADVVDLGLWGTVTGGLDGLGGYVAGAKDAAGNFLDSAGQALAWQGVMQEADKIFDNGPADGVLYDYQAPTPGSSGVMGFGASKGQDRSVKILPLGWGVIIGAGALVAWWVWK